MPQVSLSATSHLLARMRRRKRRGSDEDPEKCPGYGGNRLCPKRGLSTGPILQIEWASKLLILHNQARTERQDNLQESFGPSI